MAIITRGMVTHGACRVRPNDHADGHRSAQQHEHVLNMRYAPLLSLPSLAWPHFMHTGHDPCFGCLPCFDSCNTYMIQHAMRLCAEPGGGATHGLSGKLLPLLKKWLASAGLSCGKLCGLRKQQRNTFRKLWLRACPCRAAEVRDPEMVERCHRSLQQRDAVHLDRHRLRILYP